MVHQPKGCDVTVLNYVRCRDTREPVPNTRKPVYVIMIDWVCAINRVAASGDKTAYALLWERWLLSNLSLLYLWSILTELQLALLSKLLTPLWSFKLIPWIINYKAVWVISSSSNACAIMVVDNNGSSTSIVLRCPFNFNNVVSPSSTWYVPLYVFHQMSSWNVVLPKNAADKGDGEKDRMEKRQTRAYCMNFKEESNFCWPKFLLRQWPSLDIFTFLGLLWTCMQKKTGCNLKHAFPQWFQGKELHWYDKGFLGRKQTCGRW